MNYIFSVLTGICMLAIACNPADSAPSQKAPTFPTENWSFAGPEETGLSRDSVSKALGYLRSYCGDDGLDQTLIVKNGYIVFSGDSLSAYHNIYSATKSFTSAVLGILIDDGIVSLDDKAAKYEPLLEELYPDVTLRQFATMTSGYSAKGGNRWGEGGNDWSSTPYDPDSPLFAPGEAFAYWDEAQMMFGRVLVQAAGRDLYEVLDERLMKPIGVAHWDWWADDTIRLTNGVVAPLRNGSSGIEITPSDFSRVGWLFANHGVWNKDTLLSPDFVREAMSAQVSPIIELGKTDRSDMKGQGVYGFNWWTATPEGGGEFRMRHSPIDAAYMSGFNHNVCMVIPSKKLVIVRMGQDGNPTFGKHEVWDEILRILL